MGDDINLRTLRRTDPQVKHIIKSAGQVAVYKFDPPTNEWEKIEVEGSLFVYQRDTSTTVNQYGFTIINRLSTTNMTEDIAESLDLMIEIPYLLYKNHQGAIFCIWFYNREECFNVHRAIMNLIKTRHGQPGHNQSRPVDIPGANGGNTAGRDLMRMLTQAMAGADNNKQESSSSVDLNGSSSSSSSVPNVPNGSQRVDVQSLFKPNATRSQHTTAQGAATAIAPVTPMVSSHNVSHQKQTQQQSTPANKGANNPTKDANSRRSQSNSKNTPGKGAFSPPKIRGGQPQGQGQAVVKPLAFRAVNEGMAKISLENGVPDGQHASGAGGPTAPMSMQKLKETLIHLLKNDADFLHTIHNAYLSGLKE